MNIYYINILEYYIIIEYIFFRSDPDFSFDFH